MSKLTIEAAQRTALGGKVKALRREGWVPVVVYGNVDAPVNLQVNQRALERMLQGGGSSQLVEVMVQGGGSHNVLIRDVQRHPVRRSVIHADFYAINLSEKQQVSIPVVAVNEPESLGAGVMMLQALDEIQIEALPADIPASIEVDVTKLELDSPILVRDLPVLSGITYLVDEEEAVFNMIVTRAASEQAEEEIVGEEVSAEPEVLAKGKQDEDDE
ncbi:MAG: 50S ribosomal protein L25 [Caldilineaceae bacterium]